MKRPDFWYTEQHTPHLRFSMQMERMLYTGQSDFQRVDVFDSVDFGRVLVLDGILMITQRDEYVYHEMMVHVPMAAAPGIKNVLVIGGGDGGTVKRLLEYPTIGHIDMAEIDQKVVEVCREYFPELSAGLSDERVTLHFTDGLRYVRSQKGAYDLIIVDSTDPFGPGEGLFTREFYGNCFNALKEDGILINQHESAFYDADEVQITHQRIMSYFPVSRVYQVNIPTYPSGHWLFGFASKGIDPVEGLDGAAWLGLGIGTKYYNPTLHRGAFMLPNSVLQVLAPERE